MIKCCKIIEDIHTNIVTNYVRYSLDKELFESIRIDCRYGFFYDMLDCRNTCNLIYYISITNHIKIWPTNVVN